MDDQNESVATLKSRVSPAPPGTPWGESLAALIGVVILVCWSTWAGVSFWTTRNEPMFAWLTVAAELIAFAGLGVARHHWRTDRRFAYGAGALTIIAATWCGLTMYEKIASDGHARALAEAAGSLPYKTASDDLAAASRSLRERLSESPPPRMGPRAIEAWTASRAQAVAAVTAARDDAQRRLAAATPQSETDWLAIIRGVGIELIKLLGFLCFRVSADTRPMQVALAVVSAPLAAGAAGRAAETPQPISQPADQRIGHWPVGRLAQPFQPAIDRPVDEKNSQSADDMALMLLRDRVPIREVSRRLKLSRYRVDKLAEVHGIKSLMNAQKRRPVTPPAP
jgi:hypothetical protein